MSTTTYIERHLSFLANEYEGLWLMTFLDPFNKEVPVSIYVKAPNTHVNESNFTDKPIVQPGPRLNEVLKNLLYKIESYPYSWEFSGKKIVSYGYDFETDYTGTAITTIDLTEIATKEVNEYYNFYSPEERTAVEDTEKMSGKGILLKMKIQLAQAQSVNHLMIDYFTEYPIELLALLYKENNTLYKIPLQKSYLTNQSLILHFPSVFTQVFYLIVKQETYTIHSEQSSNEQLMLNQLWEYASDKSKAVFEGQALQYLDSLLPTESGILLHQEILDSYSTMDKNIPAPIVNEMNPYDATFSMIKQELDQEQR